MALERVEVAQRRRPEDRRAEREVGGVEHGRVVVVARREPSTRSRERLDPQAAAEVVVERRQRLAVERRSRARASGRAATARRRATSRSSQRAGASPGLERAASRHGAPAGACRSRTWAIFTDPSLVAPRRPERQSDDGATPGETPRLTGRGPDVPERPLEIFALDDVVIGRTLFEPGWHWATDVKPIAGTPSCQYHHLGVCVSGRLGIRMDDGTTFEVGPGTVFDIPAGHDGWVIGDEPWETYDFAGMRSFGRAVEPDDRVLGDDPVHRCGRLDRDCRADRRRALAPAHLELNEHCQFEVDRHRGRLVKTTGDGMLALFDSSERAVRCATASIGACPRRSDSGFAPASIPARSS